MANICRKHGATFVAHVEDPAEGDMLIEVRRRVWPAFEQLGLAMLPEDVAVPRQHLAELMTGIVAIGHRHKISLPTIGHAGDQNMHPLLVFDGTNPDEVQRAKATFEDIVKLSVRPGGTIAAEHGVGTLKRHFLSDELDPERRFNPGKAL